MGQIRRALIIVLGLAGAVASLIATQLLSWWDLDGVKVLPNKTLHCMGGTCTEANQAWMGATELWLRTGVAVTTATYLTAFGCIALAAAAAAQKTSILLARWTFASVAIAVISAILLASKPPDMLVGHLAWGGPLLLTSCVLAAVAAMLSHRSTATISPASQSL